MCKRVQFCSDTDIICYWIEIQLYHRNFFSRDHLILNGNTNNVVLSYVTNFVLEIYSKLRTYSFETH